VDAIDSISPVSATSYTTKKVVKQVYDAGEGNVKVVQDTYLVTTYNAQGYLNTVTTSHRVDYIA
tara:strand:- start:89 stop:280 length:192 start_codon:yes stop_codon:yes gene_type:complete